MNALQEWAEQFTTHWVEHPWADIAALCWLFVGIMSMVAVFYHSIRDTVLERVALAAISMGALSRATFIFGRGEVPVDGAWTAITLAIYCAVIWWKHVWVIPRRPDYKPPDEMPKY